MNPNFAYVGPRLHRRPSASRSWPAATSLETDGPTTPKVAVVNEGFARHYFPGQDALGRRFGYGAGPGQDYEIVGMVKDGKAANLREETKRFVYVPYTQKDAMGGMTFYVRAAADADALTGRVHALVRRVDPTLPVTSLKTMRAQIRESLFVERMVAALSAAFGILATLLAALGLYGVMAFAVAAAHPRDRHPHGAGRAAPRRHEDGPARRRDPRRPRAWPSACPAATASAASSRPSSSASTRRDPLTYAARHRHPARRGLPRRLRARAPGDPRGPHGRAPRMRALELSWAISAMPRGASPPRPGSAWSCSPPSASGSAPTWRSSAWWTAFSCARSPTPIRAARDVVEHPRHPGGAARPGLVLPTRTNGARAAAPSRRSPPSTTPTSCCPATESRSASPPPSCPTTSSRARCRPGPGARVRRPRGRAGARTRWS